MARNLLLLFPFKPMTTQLQAKIHELDPEHSPSVDTTQEDSTPSGEDDSQPDTLLALVHDVINNDSTMSPSDVDRVLSVNRAASTATNRAVHAHTQYVFRMSTHPMGNLWTGEQMVAWLDLT